MKSVANVRVHFKMYKNLTRSAKERKVIEFSGVYVDL